MSTGKFGEQLKEKFDAARECGSLIFTPSEQVTESVDGIQYLYTLAPSLQKKPTVEKDDHKPTLRTSPWNPPEPELVIDQDFENDYMIVLNKFAVVPRHFMLVSKDANKSQKGPLTPDDLKACIKLIKQADNETGKRHLGYFNSGVHSGASIAHKHIQFIELPPKDQFTPFVDELVAINQGYEETQRPLSDTRASFAHFAVPLHNQKGKDEELTADELGFIYSTLISRVLTVLRENEVPTDEISYNFVFTQDWMMAVPRRQESVEGRGINATGTIGLLLAKSQEDLDFYKSHGPDQVLHDMGFPPINLKEEEGFYDY